MANFNYYLKDNKAKSPTPVYLYIRYSKRTVKFYTREAILPSFWDSTVQRAKKNRQFVEHPEFNARLDTIESTAKTVFREYQNNNNHSEPSPNELKKLIEAKIRGTKSGVPVSLIEFIEYFIKLTKKRLETEKKGSQKTLVWSYGQTLNQLKEYASHKNKRVDFDSIDYDFYYDFVAYLENEKKFAANTVGRHIKTLKRFLKEAQTPEMNIVNKFTYYKRFEVFREDADTIYLTAKELQALYDLDLSNEPRLEKVRDLFLIGAWTGLRFSDFTNIHENNIKGDYIHIETKKTGQKVVIPIHWTVKEIIQKYNGLPMSISNVKLNQYLKEVGKKLDLLHKRENLTLTRGGKKIHKSVEKWKLLTTHTARRSFATNMYKEKVPTITIMAITGHRTERAFLTYIRVTPDEHAKILMGYFEKQKLRVV